MGCNHTTWSMRLPASSQSIRQPRCDSVQKSLSIQKRHFRLCTGYIPAEGWGTVQESEENHGYRNCIFPLCGHTWVCQSNQHLTPAIRKKLIPVALRQLSISLWKFKRPVPRQRSQEEAAHVSVDTGNAKGENASWLQQKTNILMPLLS